MALPAENVRYTYADYLSWDNDEERVELIDGEAIMMAPGAAQVHQEVSGELFAQLYQYLRGKSCKVFHPPFDVKLFEQNGDAPEDVDTVVQPDIIVVCDVSKLDGRGCKGAPDVVIEILSPSSKRHDKLVKFNLYQRAGVKEYWIIDPYDKTAQSFVLEDGRYVAKEFGGVEDKVRVYALKDFEFNLAPVFTS